MDGRTDYRKAFEMYVYEPHKDIVYRIALRRLGDKTAAEDVVQEVFVRAFEGLDSVLDPSRLLDWLTRIAENVIADHYRAKFMALKHEDDIRLAKAGKAPDSSAELRELLMAEIAKLPVSLQEPLLLSYESERTAPEIARLLNIAEGTVRWRLSEARNALREGLRRRISDAPALQNLQIAEAL
ncbi:MAG TPA: sigma-70 family RNA polymerase sigma factor [Planctomycetota bacterium]|jgi:RNA polymerase sigma-70 factor (ECF subfamily)